MTTTAIDVRGLTKTYRYHCKEPGVRGSLRSLFRRESLETRAVEAISFTIETGEVVGFLGPNGAGKTTTLKMLCGLLYPSGGAATVLGHTPSRRERDYLRRIALVMGQKNMLWWDIPAMETLLLHKEMYDIPAQRFRRVVDDLADLLDVERLLRVQVRKLSLGERMKMNTPDTLFYSLFGTARYPVSFFKGLIRALLTFAVPVAFATTFPAQALLGTADLRLLPVGLALAAATLVATHLFWTYAVRHYSSASS